MSFYWPLFFARAKKWAWQLGTKPILGILAVAVSSGGFRALNADFGQKLYKLPIPFADRLEEDEIGHRLDVAHALSVMLLIAAFIFSAKVLRNWMRADDEQVRGGWNPEIRRLIATVIAALVMGADAILFYYGTTQMNWSGGGFSATALVATVAYVTILVAVSFVSVELSQNVIDLSKEDTYEPPHADVPGPSGSLGL